MNCQQINGRDYSSSLFGTGKATSGHCIWFEDPHCKGDINKQKQTQGGSSDGGWKTCIWGEGVRVARMQKQGLLSCRQGGTRVPRASPLAQGGPGDTVAKPAPTGTVRALEAPAQVVAPDTAPRRQPFPCKQGVSVLGDNPDALGHSPKELWCWPCFRKGFGQEISTGLYQTKIFL